MLARLKVRTKLIATLLPLLLALGVLATLGVADRLDGRNAAQRSQTLIETAQASAAVVHDLQLERLYSVALQNGEVSAAAMLDRLKPTTDRAVANLRARAEDLSDLDISVGNQTASQVATQLKQRASAIRSARAVYKPSTGSPAAVSDAYSTIIAGLTDAATASMAAAEGSRGARSVHWLSALKEADARSGADVTTIVAATRAASLPDADWAVQEVTGLRADSLNFTTVFTTDTDEFGRKQFDAVMRDKDFVASQVPFNALSTISPLVGLDTEMGPWVQTTVGRLDALRRAESSLFTRELRAAATRSADLEREVRLFLGGSATALLLALLLAASVTRSITTSLSRLTAAARTISNDQLPRLVESLRHPEMEQEFTVTNIDLRSQDEFAELAGAFNSVERTAIDVAAEQVATLRKGISDIFVNLARRNQSLLDRQIEFIDRLEANEEDPDQLENLFKLDHLATRMRRNAESLLVLAGAEAPRRRSREVSITDVIRVAVGEVEDFARITLLAVDEADAVGSAAVDIAHLLSELMENGTQYSPPDRRVEVVGHRTNDGGYVVSITDQGVGMTNEALIEANRQLARPPVVGLSLSRSLGFVVVSTLAHRHGINVRLTDSPAGGITALVTLPPALLVQEQVEPVLAAPAGSVEVDGPMEFPDFAIDAVVDSAIIIPGTEPAPPFQLEPGLEWAPEPPAFREPDEDYSDVVPGILQEPHVPLLPPEVPHPVFEEQQPLRPPATEHTVTAALDPDFGLTPPLADFEAPAPDPAPFRDEPIPTEPWSFDTTVPAETGDVEPAPAGSRMDTAFEQGLFALLDPRAEPSPDAGATRHPEAPVTPQATPAPQAPPPPQVHETAFPPAPPLPATPPPLPQRSRRDPVATAEATSERIGTPTRPPEEIRRILSSYRSGLHSGRSDAAPSTDDRSTAERSDVADEMEGPRQ